MLHRLSLRVLPQLNALVTDTPVRKRKRWVMLVPGLVAFGIYRLLKMVLPLSDPFMLLGLSGSLSAMAAVWSFQKGRGLPFFESVRQDGVSCWGWLVGWIGIVYGMQLSLLVLSLLQIFVNYDFLLHPEGPAMMAIIIACTSVTRDAFEIGHVQRKVREGVPVPTFPDGKSFREWVPRNLRTVATWGGLSLMAGLLGSWVIYRLGPSEMQPIFQSIGVSLVLSTVTLLAFWDGQGRFMSGEKDSAGQVRWLSALWFWIWPAFTFSATYFLVLWGISVFVFQATPVSQGEFQVLAGLTGLIMAAYMHFLGWRKSVEERTLAIPESIQRCPFVMGILQNSKAGSALREFPDMPASQNIQINKR